MRHYVIVLAVFMMLMASCGGNKSGSSHNEASVDTTAQADPLAIDSLPEITGDIPMPKAADELFDDFVFNFAANRRLQMERVAFPLSVIKEGKEEKLQKSQWQMEYFFMKQDYYTLLFDSEQHMEIVKDTSVRHAVVEKIFFESSSVRQYVFNRLRGAWMLTSMRTIPISQSSNASFLEFYHQFASDVDFQQKHLAETVKFVGPDPDDDFSQMEGDITPDTWGAFAPELPSGMIYNIIYGQPHKEGNTKLFVLRGIANGMELELTFRKVNGQWKLHKFTT